MRTRSPAFRASRCPRGERGQACRWAWSWMAPWAAIVFCSASGSRSRHPPSARFGRRSWPSRRTASCNGAVTDVAAARACLRRILVYNYAQPITPTRGASAMPYDLLIKNGRIIDGSGRPAFHGDVGVARGRIVELGRLDGPARRVIEADGRVVAPGFVDNHCHYDAQVLWDPLCTFSSHHGATGVVIGNCSLALAPVRTHEREKLAGMLSYVEAIPMDVLQAGVPWTWETFPEYMRAIGQKLGVNVGTLIGHSAVRQYAMGEAASQRDATGDELTAMRQIVREAIDAG